MSDPSAATEDNDGKRTFKNPIKQLVDTAKNRLGVGGSNGKNRVASSDQRPRSNRVARKDSTSDANNNVSRSGSASSPSSGGRRRKKKKRKKKASNVMPR